jgi:hypothetical protein
MRLGVRCARLSIGPGDALTEGYSTDNQRLSDSATRLETISMKGS